MTTTHITQEQKHKSKTKRTATPAKSEDWDMLPDVEDLEKIVNRELKKLEEFEKHMNGTTEGDLYNVSTKEK